MPMTKIAYNACFGGFSLSADAVRLARELSGDPTWGGCVLKGELWDDGTISMGDYTSIDWTIERTDPVLTNVIEMLGAEANGEHAFLLIREVEPGTRYRIEEYDGNETIRLESEYTWETA